MPAFPLIDTHVHLYDLARHSYGWMAGLPKINRTHLMPDFDAATAGIAVEKLVFVEVAADPGQYLGEAAFAQEIADRDPRLAAIIAHAPVENGAAVKRDLEILLAHKNLRGIRRLIQGEVNPGMCLEPGFIAGVKLLARHNLLFELCIKHWAMPYAIALVKQCPDVMFVLDHIGKPDIRHGLHEPWWSQLRELARLPNVVCKISGAIGETAPAPWTPAQVAPYVAHAIECFGFSRCMFGSDWTVSELTHSYGQWVGLVDHVIHGASLEEQRQLYCGTARHIYRM